MTIGSVYAALGLTRNPFPPTPDAGSYFFTPQLEEEFAEIAHCIQARKGFVLLTGEVGLGKSTLVRRLLDTLPAESCQSALVLNTFLQGESLLGAIASDFGLPPAHGLEAGLAQLNAFLLSSYRQSKTCVLVIDDAQNLSTQSLELIRLLCNLETDQEKLLQILLVGQPELEQALAVTELRQLKSRIVKHTRLRGLLKEELARYFDFRVNSAGGAGRLTMEPAAAEVLYRATAGNLRQLHLVLDRCLYGLAASRQCLIKTDLMRRAVAEVPSLRPTEAALAAQRDVTARKGRAWTLGGLALGVTTVAFAAWAINTGGSGQVPTFAPVGPPTVAIVTEQNQAAPVATPQAAGDPAETASPVVTLPQPDGSPNASTEGLADFQPKVKAESEPEPDSLAACQKQLNVLLAGGQLVEIQSVAPDVARRIKPSSRVCFFSDAGQPSVAWISNGSARQIGAAQQAVRSAQLALKNLGWLDVVAPDGLLGPRTSEALARFQQQHRLAPTGQLDEMTFLLLENTDAATR